MTNSQRIKILNRLFSLSPFAKETYFYASFGINAALEDAESKKDGISLLPLDCAAKNLVSIYDDSIKVELVEISEKYFDALFILPEISSAVKKLAGYENAMLVVSGLLEASLDGGKRMSALRKKEYAQNVEFIEDYVMRYKSSFKNLEIIFL